MSKRALKKFLQDAPKDALEEQILDLYTRFKEVKGFYDFVFNPKESERVEEAKAKISLEFFPIGHRKKAKLRPSVASKFILRFQKLGMRTDYIADLMFYHIEIALIYSKERRISRAAFYRSMQTRFNQALNYVLKHELNAEFEARAEAIVDQANMLDWENKQGMDRSFDTFKEGTFI